MRELILYGTQGCHLCEVAEGLLAASLDFDRYQVELVDIADDDELVDRYGVRIPVLRDVTSGAELGWPFDAAAVGRFLSTLPEA